MLLQLLILANFLFFKLLLRIFNVFGRLRPCKARQSESMVAKVSESVTLKISKSMMAPK